MEGRAKKVRCCQAHVSGGAWASSFRARGMETLKTEQNLQICAYGDTCSGTMQVDCKGVNKLEMRERIRGEAGGQEPALGPASPPVWTAPSPAPSAHSVGSWALGAGAASWPSSSHGPTRQVARKGLTGSPAARHSLGALCPLAPCTRNRKK